MTRTGVVGWRRPAAVLLALCAAASPLSLADPAPTQAERQERLAQPAPNGVAFPQGYRDWKVVGISHRSDNNSLRVILGNEVAVEHARSGAGRSWPAGSILVKVVWKDQPHPEWEFAATPGDFVHLEVMQKDARRFPYTGGWGFGRWIGAERIPYGASDEFAKECFACHEPVAQTDYVFTRPIFRQAPSGSAANQDISGLQPRLP